MRSISYEEFRDTTGLTPDRLKVLRQRGHTVRAFGASEIYESLGYIELDVVAVRLADVLAEKLDRTLAADLVRDQWGVWSRVVAVAEAAPDAPIFWYVVEYETKKGERWYLTVGSDLDSRSDINLRELAQDLYQRAGVVAKNYVVVEMQSVLADVRAAAERAKHDFTAAFLPPYGSDELEQVMKPFDETTPDRAIIVNDKAKAKAADVARRAGILARAKVDASLPAKGQR
jgi:hypothetical protein